MPFSATPTQSKEPMPEQVLTIEEVAALLKRAEKTVYANARELPGFKIRRQRRLRRTELEYWMDEQRWEGGDGEA